MNISPIDLALSGLFLLTVYKYLTKNDNFFKSRGVKYAKPTIGFGNFLGLFTGLEDGFTVFQKVYNKFKDEKICGYYLFMRPAFMIKDAELMKQITIKDFHIFVNHDGHLTKGCDGIFAKSLALLEDNQWKEMRSFLSPIFTSSKLKIFFNHLTACTRDLCELFEDTLKKTGRVVINTTDIFGRFTAESISSGVLGIKGNCIKQKDSKIFKLATDIQDDLKDLSGAIKLGFISTFPTLAKLLKVQIFRKSTHDFLKKYVIDEMTRRELAGETNARDIIQMLIEAKNGRLEAQTVLKHTDWNDYELLAAQVLIFFTGGYDTITTLMQMCSWELAMNQDVQKKLMQEVDDTLKGLKGNPITYDILHEMKFLTMVVSETLRKWPSVPFSGREAGKDHKIVTSDGQIVEIKKGDMCMLPYRLIQHDPKYYENPSKFDPYRFSEENKHKIVPGTFLAFGFGPRMCLGSRLALLEIKLVFFTILSKYTIEVCDKTPNEVTYSQSPFSYKQNVFVELKPRA